MTWLREQVHAAADLQVVHRMLREKGLSDQDIAAGIEAVRPLDSALKRGTIETPPLIRRAPPKLRRLDVPKAEVYAYDDFLSPKDCARVIALSAHHLQPSPVANDPGDVDYRSSTTCALAQLRSPVALEVDAKICRGIGIRPEYSEGIQAQRYDVGQQFKAHWDYFEPDSTDYLRFASITGNRTWTVMIYLNDGMEGGATRFVNADYAVVPKAGMALMWNNLHADGTPNRETKHSGEPVTRGHKVIITKWFRVMGTGPQFYE